MLEHMFCEMLVNRFAEMFYGEFSYRWLFAVPDLLMAESNRVIIINELQIASFEIIVIAIVIVVVIVIVIIILVIAIIIIIIVVAVVAVVILIVIIVAIAIFFRCEPFTVFLYFVLFGRKVFFANRKLWEFH